MTTFRTLASGSSGNAALLSRGDVQLLIDMGVSCRRLCQALAALGLTADQLTGVLITHEHGDHIRGLETFVKKYRVPIFCTPAVSRQLIYRIAGIEPLLQPLDYGESVLFGDVEAEILPTSHDCPGSAAWHFTAPEGRVGYLTDTGMIMEGTGARLLGADLLVLESNHDVEMLRAGRYPYSLKRRILGPQGHLSNEDAAAYAAGSVRAGTRMVLLVHLSEENNTPQTALAAMNAAMEGMEAVWEAAPRYDVSRAYVLEDSSCGG